MPVTTTSFTIAAADAPGVSSSVTIGQTHPNPGTPLSAGGALEITASTITSSGTLYAPFGTIDLDAGNSLTLANGSLTSVSGGGLAIPYGETTLGGQEWVYGTGNQITGVPARVVNLTAPNVAIAQQATIDLKGGGDLSAFEWVPGSGGSQDALAPGVIPGLYAIVPSTRGQASPQDPNSADSSIFAGESVYLSGGGWLGRGCVSIAAGAVCPGARRLSRTNRAAIAKRDGGDLWARLPTARLSSPAF